MRTRPRISRPGARRRRIRDRPHEPSTGATTRPRVALPVRSKRRISTSRRPATPDQPPSRAEDSIVGSESRPETRPQKRSVPRSRAPSFLTRDLHETLAFYDRLGFVLHGAPIEQYRYLIIARGSIELTLLRATNRRPAHHGPRLLRARARCRGTAPRLADLRCSDGSRDRKPAHGCHEHRVRADPVRTRGSQRQPTQDRLAAQRIPTMWVNDAST